MSVYESSRLRRKGQTTNSKDSSSPSNWSLARQAAEEEFAGTGPPVLPLPAIELATAPPANDAHERINARAPRVFRLTANPAVPAAAPAAASEAAEVIRRAARSSRSGPVSVLYRRPEPSPGTMPPSELAVPDEGQNSRSYQRSTIQAPSESSAPNDATDDLVLERLAELNEIVAAIRYAQSFRAMPQERPV